MELFGMRVVEKKNSPKVFFVCAQRTRGKAEGLSAEDAAAAAKRFPDPPRAIRRDKALTDGFAIAVAAADAAAP